jgi:hypothetical protein
VIFYLFLPCSSLYFCAFLFLPAALCCARYFTLVHRWVSCAENRWQGLGTFHPLMPRLFAVSLLIFNIGDGPVDCPSRCMFLHTRPACILALESEFGFHIFLSMKVDT